MNWVQFINEHFTALAFIVALAICVPLIWVAGDPLTKIVQAIVKEFAAVLRAEVGPSSLNAIGGVVTFLFGVFVVTRGPIEIITARFPNNSTEGFDIPAAAIAAFLIPLLLIYFLVSIKMNSTLAGFPNRRA